VISHAAIVASVLCNADEWRLQASDRTFLVLPLFHCNALFMQFMPAAYSGALTVMSDRFSASRWLATVKAHRITIGNITAGPIRSVLAQPPSPDDARNELRIVTFGLPLHAEEQAEFRRRFGVDLYMGFGMTESCAGGTRTPLHIDGKRGWQVLGTTQRGWEVRTVDDDDNDVGAGEVGEVVYRGPGIFTRYWNNEEATAETLRGGWLHTGDLARIDEDGFLHFVSRKKDMIKPRGENVAASEIEEVLDRHPAVGASAAIGVFDPHRDERIVAFLEVEGPVEDDELRAWCADSLAAFKVPEEFIRVDELPRTSIGKINKGQLRTAAETRAPIADAQR